VVAQCILRDPHRDWAQACSRVPTVRSGASNRRAGNKTASPDDGPPRWPIFNRDSTLVVCKTLRKSPTREIYTCIPLKKR
jgi:hypothetical protein